MKQVPRFLGVALILALLNMGFINVALASKAPSRKVLTASAVSLFATKSSEPIPAPTPSHATKADIKGDLDDTKNDLQTIIGTDPNGFAAQLLSNAGLDPVGDIDDAKTDLDSMSDTDFNNAQSHFDNLHKKFQKRKHNTAAILRNPTLMAMLHRPSPVRYRIVVGNSDITGPANQKAIFSNATETNRPLSFSKSGPASGRYSKDLANLRVVMLPELDKTCSKGNGIPNGINDLILAKAVTLATETIKEAIPDDTAQIIPHSIAVVAWAAAKTAEFVLDALHQTYQECKAVQDGAQSDATLNTIENAVTNVPTIHTNVVGIKGDVTNIKTTVGNTSTTVNNISSKVDSTSTTVNNINNNVTNIGSQINTINNTVNNISTTATTTSNNVNTANTNITAAQNSINVLSALSLRLMIEADLAAPDNATPVALFETPAAKQGYLDLVRSIVAETIANLAGSSTSQANSFLAQGDAYKAAGNYKAAYAAYRKAYKSASN